VVGRIKKEILDKKDKQGKKERKNVNYTMRAR
jgi:hypothetical protein